MTSRTHDYLLPELRNRVEELKADIRKQPTDPAALQHRAALAWGWANALARSGGIIPMEMPFFIEAVSLGDQAGKFSVLRRDPDEASAELDRMIRELILKDEHPGALGSLQLAATSPVPVDSWQTFKQTYTFGEVAMKPGGGFLVSKTVVANHGEFQWTDPEEDNYVSVRASRPQSRLLPATTPIKGFRGGIRTPKDVLVYKLAEGGLGPGDSITVTYGDRSAGSRGIKVQSFTNDTFCLPIYVDFDGDGNFVTFEYPRLQVIGGPVTGVHIFVPAVVKTMESFSICVRSEDRFGNRASGRIPEYEVSLDGRKVGRLPAGDSAVGLVTDVTVREPGAYRFGVRSADGAIRGTSDPIWVSSEPRSKIYFGDIHGHCGLADGQGSPEGYVRFGRDDARLDFICLTEHDVFMDDHKWTLLKDTVRDFRDEGKYIPILGFECTAPPGMGGHHNVYFRGTDADFVPLHRASPLPRLFEVLGEENDPENVFVVPHAHQAADWRKASPTLISLVEVHSQHGSFEWLAERYIEEGHRIGFAGGGDNHQGHPGRAMPTGPDHMGSPNGLTAAVAPAKTSDALFAALRDRHTYATSGERILLDFEVNGAGIGEGVTAAPNRSIRARVSGTRPLARVEVLRNGIPLLTKRYGVSLKKQSWIRIAFRSTSLAYEHDNPRGYRIWRGFIDFGSAVIRKVETPGLFAQHLEHAEISGGDPRRVTFEVRTRGHANVILIELDRITDESRLAIHCDPSTEFADSRYLRERQEIPPVDLAFRLADLKHDRVLREIVVDDFHDSVEVDVVDPLGPLDDFLGFSDQEAVTTGDYYYMRIEQIDGSLAWTSPVWVD